MDRQPELLVQTLAGVNARWWGFPAGGSTVCIFGRRPRNVGGTSSCPRVVGVAAAVISSSSGGGLWTASGCVRDARSEGMWRERSSMRSSTPAVLSGVEGEMLAVVGSGVTSQILSARWEAVSRLPSVCPACMAYMCGGSRLDQMVQKKSSGTSGGRPLRCRKNCDGH